MKTVCTHCSKVSQNQPIGDACHNCSQGTMQTQVTIHFELRDHEALALAQFVKRCGWTDWKNNASSEAEIYNMRAAFSKLERALALSGYEPR